ncbi:unnamed protein product [Soboliphyme baturini]|uniref:Acyl_transf_3 domain-containing protein n=1 Tax=Soboliphyme baturini TaxID=241478 RepID=A0A183J4K0_9BILA|nr:unnamed protein product [Soboliphyme baturini]
MHVRQPEPTMNHREMSRSSESAVGRHADVMKLAKSCASRFLLIRPYWPGLERSIYWLMTVGVVVYPWIKLYEVSSAYDWRRQPTYFVVNRLWGFGERPKDTTDLEWSQWCYFASQLFPYYFIHAVLFNVASKLLPQRIWSLTMLFYWVTACCIVFHPSSVIVVVSVGAVMYTVTALTRSIALVWIMSCCFLYLVMDMLPELPINKGISHYGVIAFFTYKIVQFTSYCLDSIESKSSKRFFEGIYEMFWYSFYYPYLVYLIVPFKHFAEGMNRRKAEQQNLYRVAFFALRVLFWYTLINVGLYFFYFSAIVNNTDYLDQLPRDALCSIGCCIGQFFHMKYVVIFGLQALFAKLDKLEPPAGPICISRVTLYSKLWRYFDRGLYSFFKEYIFVPICRPSFSVPRRLLAMLLCFGFVILWHGSDHNYIVWVSLNIAEILLENTSRAIYNIPAVKSWRERHISDGCFRRILALLCVIPYTFGLYSNFYFLSTSEAGYIFVNKFFWSDTIHLRYPFLILVFFGYCFANVTIELDSHLEQKKTIIKTDYFHVH